MAIVTQVDRINKDGRPHLTKTHCSSFVVRGDDGQTYLTLETYGSEHRQSPGKESQTIQFTAQAAAQLKALIEETFPNLK